MLRITIDENQPGVKLEEITANNEETKFVDLDAIKHIFASNIVMETPLLPQGAIYYQKLENGNEIIILVKMEHKNDITITRPDRMVCQDVNIPIIVMGIVIGPNGNKLRDALGTLQRYPLTLDETVYAFPLCNVYGDGHICWGRVDDPGFGVSRSHRYLELFLGSEFNGDLMGYGPNLRGVESSLEGKVRSMQEEVNPDGMFSKRIAFGSHYNSTIRGMINRLKDNSNN